jgi:tetratricopeptide (TPR) repeat protein
VANSSLPIRYLLGSIAAVTAIALIAGCSGSSSPMTPLGSATQQRPAVKGHCTPHGGVRVDPCAVTFNASNPGPDTGTSDEGEVLLTEALATARRLDNRGLEALLLGDIGTTRSRRGDIEGARSFYAEALAHYMPLGLERPAASIAGHLAEVEFAAGDAAAALQRAEEARIGHEATHNRRSAANDLSNMAAYLVALDCFDDAKIHASLALAAARDVKATVLTAFILQHFAAVGILQPSSPRRHDARERAAMLLGFVDARLAALGAAREYTVRQEYERILAALTERFGERLSDVMALGAQWDEDSAIVAALDR